MNKSVMTFGLCIVTAKGKKVNAQMAHTGLQAAPGTIAISLSKSNYTYEIIDEVGKFSLSVISTKTSKEFIEKIGYQSGRDTDKMKGVNVKITSNDIPVVTDNAIAYIECEVVGKQDLITHEIIIAKVIGTEILSNEDPMTIKYYEEVLKGKVPKQAPVHEFII